MHQFEDYAAAITIHEFSEKVLEVLMNQPAIAIYQICLSTSDQYLVSYNKEILEDGLKTLYEYVNKMSSSQKGYEEAERELEKKNVYIFSIDFD